MGNPGFQDEDSWSDNLSIGSACLINFDTHCFGVNPADMSSLRVTMQFVYSGTTFLTLNLSGSSAFGNAYFRVAAQRFSVDTPGTGNFCKCRLTLWRFTGGAPALIWVDNIRVAESGNEHYHEWFTLFGEYDYHDDMDLNDVEALFECRSGKGIEYDPMECNAFYSDDDEDVDFAGFAAARREFSGAI